MLSATFLQIRKALKLEYKTLIYGKYQRQWVGNNLWGGSTLYIIELHSNKSRSAILYGVWFLLLCEKGEGSEWNVFIPWLQQVPAESFTKNFEKGERGWWLTDSLLEKVLVSETKWKCLLVAGLSYFGNHSVKISWLDSSSLIQIYS